MLEVRGQGSGVRGQRFRGSGVQGWLPGDLLAQELTLSDLRLQEVRQQSEREPGANHSAGPEHGHRE